MLACAPTGCMLREVAIHVRESQVMASVNKEWADTVRAVKRDLTRQLLKSAAELVQGLGIRTLQHAKRNKTISFQDIMKIYEIPDIKSLCENVKAIPVSKFHLF